MEDDAVLLHHNPSGPSSLAFSSPSPLRQHDLMAYLERLQHFLATAPNRWPSQGNVPASQHHHALNRFLLPSGEYVTCVLWNGRYFITGTDIVRALVFRFEAFGRPVRNMKKFEEGVFSDLRNLKPGQDACLEEPKSQFLDLLFKFQCIRTQKKQKVFYWFSVPHDRLFIDALERDLKREKMGTESTTEVVTEPARSFSYDPKRPLFEQFNIKSTAASRAASCTISLPELTFYNNANVASRPVAAEPAPVPSAPPPPPQRSSGFFNMFSFLEGAPNYKQRRKKVKRPSGLSLNPCLDSEPEKLYGRRSLEVSLAAPPIGRRSLEGRRSYEAPSPRQNLDGTPSYGQYPMPAPIRVPSIHMPPVAQPQPQQVYGALELQRQAQEIGTERSMEVDIVQLPQQAAPAVPQFNHVLTAPDNEQQFAEYEEEKVFSNGVPTPPESAPATTTKWGEEATAYPQSQPSYISPFAYNVTPSTSVSGSSPAMSLSQIQTQMPQDDQTPSHSQSNPFSFPPPSPLPHPLSAPSHKLTFDIPPLPNSSSNDPRPGHARRPSTASAVPSATASGSGFHSHSWRYQPYPIRRVPTESGNSSPCVSTRGGSPFAFAANTPPKEYAQTQSGAENAMGMEYAGAAEYQQQQHGPEYLGHQQQQQLEYASSVSSASASESYAQTVSANSSPEVPFAHMLRLQSGSPNMQEELAYPPPPTTTTTPQQIEASYEQPSQASYEQSPQSSYEQQQYAAPAYDTQQQDAAYAASQSSYSPYAAQCYPQGVDTQSYVVSQGPYYEQPVV